MGKRIGLVMSIIFVSLLFVGCATERMVAGNTFQSSSPKLNIPVDQSFKYIGKTTTEGTGSDYVDQDRSYLNQTEFHLFVPRDASQRLDRFLVISITTSTATRFQNSIQNNQGNLNLGTIDMQGDTYHCYSVVFSPRGTWSFNKFAKESGYLLPSCVLGRFFESRSYRSTLIGIYYYEDATPSGMTCKQKYTRDSITDVQQRYLQELHQRALKAIGG